MADEGAATAGPRVAFGAPGMAPRWTHGDKDGVGTAYSADSRLWFTLWRGIVTEAYFPTIDQPQLRDLQFLVTDGESFFHEEKRHLRPHVERLSRHALGFRVRSEDPEGRYAISKEVIAAPHLPALLERVRLEATPAWRSRLQLYVLCAPHLEGGGWGNSARVTHVAGRSLLTATKGGSALALGASVPFRKTSCGYVGASDGWTDLASHRAMTWSFDSAPEGNVALTGEVELGSATEFTLALGFGRGLPHATTALLQALASPYAEQRTRFLDQWERACAKLLPLDRHTGDGGDLLHASYSVLLGHEDKNYPGAFIASLAVPWGYARGDEDRGGYHLVWTRDLVHIATGLLAAGNHEAPLRALVYLASRQQADGGFPQNFWIPGEPYWTGVQLDEVSHPILLAWHLHRERALGEFDPYPMVLAAAGFLVRHGPVTQQDRWEEVEGYSPSTLAVHIAALVAAGEMAHRRGDDATGTFLEEYADYLEAHLDGWTVTSSGTLEPAVPHHYVRVRPSTLSAPPPPPGADDGTVELPNQPPGSPTVFPAREVVDPGFLELVRYGIRAPDDPTVVGSLRVVDRLLRVETPFGPAWRRYNHDGYGQQADGGPFVSYGQGRAWPLLTGERGHYELAARRDPKPFLVALEKFASSAGLLPEQVWDEADRPAQFLQLGRPTGSAMPLAWAHGEYLCLVRSISDGHPFERMPELERRYARARRRAPSVIVWKRNHPTAEVPERSRLRIIAPEPFRLHVSQDDWTTYDDLPSIVTKVGAEFVDVPVVAARGRSLRFTFYWPARAAWEGRDYAVAVVPGAPG